MQLLGNIKEYSRTIYTPHGIRFVPIEIKSTQTFNTLFFEGTKFYCELAGIDAAQSVVVYAGKDEQKLSSGALINWAHTSRLVE